MKTRWGIALLMILRKFNLLLSCGRSAGYECWSVCFCCSILTLASCDKRWSFLTVFEVTVNVSCLLSLGADLICMRICNVLSCNTCWIFLLQYTDGKAVLYLQGDARVVLQQWGVTKAAPLPQSAIEGKRVEVPHWFLLIVLLVQALGLWSANVPMRNWERKKKRGKGRSESNYVLYLCSNCDFFFLPFLSLLFAGFFSLMIIFNWWVCFSEYAFSWVSFILHFLIMQ